MEKQQFLNPSGKNSGFFKFLQRMKLTIVFILLATLGLSAQNITVTGKVTNTAGDPLQFVSIRIKGATGGTSTNAGGTFTLSAPANATLQLSSVGYESVEMPLNGRTDVTIVLPASTKLLDQVVVVGYGVQRKIDVTGAVNQVKGEEISKQASINPISGLQGKVAGVQITNSGGPGASPQIRIRGLGTVYGNPNPLYVVDGVWFDDISFLNTADIENMNILKDASSEAIYGIRAANGVVIISTKKGKPGKPIVNYSGYIGYQKVTNQVKMANASEYTTLVNELSAVTGGGQVLDPAKYNNVAGTDWYHQILRNALVTNHQVSVSGGGGGSTYSLSLGYLDQEGIVKTNEFKRYTARLQNDFQVFKPLKIGYTVTGSSSNSQDINGGIFHQLFSAYPVVPVYYADGSYGDPNDFPLGSGANFNPQATIDNFHQQSKNYRLTGNAYADLKFAKHFTLHSSIGGEFGQSEVRNYVPVYKATFTQQNSTSVLSIGRGDVRNWIVENTITYDNKFNDHSVKVFIGQSAQRYKSYTISASAQNVPDNSDGDLYLRLGNTTGVSVIDGGDLSTIASYFGRVNYSFKNKYLLNASMRTDGSSKFFGSNRWGYFPSVGAGWIISDESFMKSQKIFDHLKLRGSWGIVGNASVPSNVSVLQIAQGGYLNSQFGGTLLTGRSVNSVVPPTTYWEKGVGTDIGLEAAVLDNRLTIEADYYIKKTQNAIFAIPILNSIGTNSNTIIANQATFENRGFELAITYKKDIGKDLTYSISGNVAINNNKVASTTTGNNPIFAGGAASTGGALSTRTIVGEPIGEFYGLQVAGIFQTPAEVTGSAQPNAKAGDFKYVDQNKDGVIDGKDRVVLGNPNPKYSFGLNTTWNYKAFDLTIDLQGIAGVQVYNANLGLRFGNENFSQDFYDHRWHGAGTSTTYPSANIGGGTNYLPNSFFVEDGSYLRVRNLQLGYTLPHKMIDRWRLNKLRVYANAQNPFNFFKYKGFSPEVAGSPTNAGIDINVYPLYATYNFGINLTF